MKRLVKESILRLHPYQNGSHSEELILNHKKVLKLDSNEATNQPSPSVTAALLQYIQNGPINWYPDVESKSLCRALSDYVNLPTDHILSFNGSDHALETIARTFISSGDEVILFTPTYDHFRVYVESCDGRIINVAEDSDQTLAQKISGQVNSRTKIIYVVNPNNPTGRLISKKEIAEAAGLFPETLFIIDEAYYEFCELTAKDLIPTHGNLVVTRSFSKAFGLAGLRCGYMLAQPQICEHVAKIRVGKNINALAQVAATAALEDLDHMKRYVEEVQLTKEWLISHLGDMGLTVKNTPLNFILLKTARPKKVTEYLKEHNIYVRDRSNLPGLEGCLRVTIGDQFLMKRFWRVFLEIPESYLFSTAGIASSDKTKELLKEH